MSVSKEQREALKATLKKLREERGAVIDEITRRNKERQAARKQVRSVLTAGPATVPSIAEACGLPTKDVLWHVAAMRKYGSIVETGTDGDYCTYGLVAAGEAHTAEGSDE